ncbi:MAG: type I secretion system permease/ATPase [Alphaproteobacteria bacterium]|nr:type I secretion system permease/ATPase [Alphaproteobacteria bacterium]MBO6629679.1 type I secretion system permease/ATPase [Alphaproteobacteria bacterium]MDF1625849.1 type I secretion system permease/ATPase [Parvibaculaceae bacterium]
MDSGLGCIALLTQYYRLPFEPTQTCHELGLTDGIGGPDDVLRVAKHIGFRARKTAAAFDRLPQVSLPCIAIKMDGTFLVLARAAENRVLVQDPAEQAPQELTREEFEAIWSGDLILLTTRTGIAGDQRKFDVSWFVPAIVKYRKLFGEVLLASFFLQIFALVTPLFFQLVIDRVLVHRGLTTLDVLVFGLIAISVFEVILGALRTYTFSHTTSRVDVVLGASLFKHLMALPVSYFEARQTGQTVARVRELETIRSFLTGSALTLVIDIFFTVVFFAVMWLYSPTLTLVVLGSIPFYVILSIIVTPMLRARVEERFQRGAENQTFLVESVVGVQTLKAMAVEPQMQRRWEDQLAGYVTASFKAANLGNVAGQVAQFINKIVIALTLWIGAKLVIEGAITVGQLVAFNMLAGRVSGPILRLAQLWQDFQQARISVDRLGDILNQPTETTGGAGRSNLPALNGRVTFDHVVFRYRPGGAEVLKDVSLEISPGEVLGIVGPSGSGKSTLTKLAQRLYVPESGRVLVDGVDIAMIDPSWLRRQIGVVLQENMLFNRTVRENIALANPAMPMERVVAAAQLSGAHEFILELANGYDTVLEERGGNLSGGQRQRIAIARALVTNPRILIFDEATSALDYESEYLIQKNMEAISEGRTVMIIAHRLAAVRNANRIITVEEGRITETGSHDELLRRGGRYASLYRHQSGALDLPAE